MQTNSLDTGNKARRELGDYLRMHRELCQVSLHELAQRTKIPYRTLEYLEAGQWADLPAVVFIRGFVRAYGQQLGIAAEADDRLTLALGLIHREEQSRTEPVGDAAAAVGLRRRFGLALFVILLLIIATITLSALWGVGSEASVRASLQLPQVERLHPSTLQVGRSARVWRRGGKA